MQLLKRIASLLNKERGQSIAEYAIVLGVFASIFIYIGATSIDFTKMGYRSSMAPYSMNEPLPEPEEPIHDPFEMQEDLIAKINGSRYIKPGESWVYKNVSSSGSAITEVYWSIKKGNTVILTGSGNDIAFSPPDTTPTSYMVSLTVKNADGKTASTSIMVDLTQNAPKAVLKMSEETDIINPKLSGALSSLTKIKGYYAGDVIAAYGTDSYDEDDDPIEFYHFESEGVSGSIKGVKGSSKNNKNGYWALDSAFVNSDGVIKITLVVEDIHGNKSEPVSEYIAYGLEGGDYNPSTNNYSPIIEDINATTKGDEICFQNPKANDKEDGNITSAGNFYIKDGNGTVRKLSEKNCFQATNLITFEIYAVDSKNDKSNILYAGFLPQSYDVLIGVGKTKMLQVETNQYFLKASIKFPRFFETESAANKYKYTLSGESTTGYSEIKSVYGKTTQVIDFSVADYAIKPHILYIKNELVETGTMAEAAVNIEGFYIYRDR